MATVVPISASLLVLVDRAVEVALGGATRFLPSRLPRPLREPILESSGSNFRRSNMVTIGRSSLAPFGGEPGLLGRNRRSSGLGGGGPLGLELGLLLLLLDLVDVVGE